jgi:hypothetical protein
MFERVCGLALKNAVVMTTHWDVAGNEKAVRLQQELVTEERYFKPLCDAGANIFGHDNTCGSAQRVVDKLLGNNPIVLQMQEELEAGMTLEQTAAGSQLSGDLDALRKRHEAEMKNIRSEMADATKAKDEAWQKVLNDELARLREDNARLTNSIEELKRPPYVLFFFCSYTTSLRRFLKTEGGEIFGRDWLICSGFHRWLVSLSSYCTELVFIPTETEG